MNNLQVIIRNDTRAAMHMAVELCEQGDFDSINEALGWLMMETCDENGKCVITPIAPGSDMGRCSACNNVADVSSNYCWKCGARNKAVS